MHIDTFAPEGLTALMLPSGCGPRWNGKTECGPSRAGMTGIGSALTALWSSATPDVATESRCGATGTNSGMSLSVRLATGVPGVEPVNPTGQRDPAAAALTAG